MIAIASDHAGFPLKEEIKKFLEEKNIEFIDCGAHSTDSVDYAKFAQVACLKVTEGYADKAILCCGTGIGISMAANKVKLIDGYVYFSWKPFKKFNYKFKTYYWAECFTQAFQAQDQFSSVPRPCRCWRCVRNSSS